MMENKKRLGCLLAIAVIVMLGCLALYRFNSHCIARKAAFETNPVFFSGTVVGANFESDWLNGDRYYVTIESCVDITRKHNEIKKIYRLCGNSDTAPKVNKVLIYQWPDASRVARGSESAFRGQILKLKINNMFSNSDESEIYIPQCADVIERINPDNKKNKPPLAVFILSHCLFLAK